MVVRPGRIMKWLYPGVIWRGNKNERSVYLTFDDGPIPEVTPWVLALLNRFKVKATFFCVGENVDKHPEVYDLILQEGHRVGNHTYHHINNWNHSSKKYYKSIDLAADRIESEIFRPPHGKIFPWDIIRLKRKFSKIIMWDVLTYDFDKNLNREKVFENVINYTRNGSVIVFHDSLKAWPHLQEVLPKSIEWLIKNKYEFKLIEN